ncbi:MAG: hypothetical protein WCH05_03070 [Chlorobiaceae bacterium]
MSQNINIKEDPIFAPLLADLQKIASELTGNGELEPITGTEESSVVIEFEIYGEGEEAEPSILIKITSKNDFFGDEELLDEFEDLVIGKLEEASRNWSQEVTELLGDDRPIILLINGEEC